jgi:hypothetical protein
MRAWVNGNPVIDNPAVNSLRRDAERVPIDLKPGRNTLLLKIEESRGTWQFCCRLLPFRIDDYLDCEFFEINSAHGAKPRVQLKEHALAGLLQAVRFTLADRTQAARILWSGHWDHHTRVSLPVQKNRWGEYELIAVLTFEGGVERCQVLRFSTGRREDFTVFKNGKTNYRIVVGRQASAGERWGAEFLSKTLQRISGAPFPVVSDEQPASAEEIMIGLNTHVRQHLKETTSSPDPEDESFTYQSSGPAIMIWGGSQRGTLYGIFSWLENELGCRWLTSTVDVIPPRAEYTFSHLSHHERPALANRAVDYFDVYQESFGVPNRINGQRFVRGEQVGGLKRLWLEHSFEVFMPPQEFFAVHPEYYALRDGRRQKKTSQLCLTNPKILPIFVERFKKFLRENPGYVVYNVAQNDNINYCQCETCRALTEHEGSEMGPVLQFVNQVAAAIEPEFPNVVVGTFAYQYTRKPPHTIRPRHNVLICLCSIECDFSHPFDHANNADFMRDLKAWSAITDRLFIWDYVVDYSHYWLPYPNLGIVQRNIQILRDHKVQGILEQAQYQCRGGEFSELRAWLLARLLWNPDLDLRTEIEGFMDAYYGRAGRAMLSYLDLLQQAVTNNSYLTIWTEPDNPIYTHALIQRADDLFDRAEQLADNVEIRARVERARLSLRYLKIMRDPWTAEREGEWGSFQTVMRHEGIDRVGEGTLLSEMVEHINGQLARKP